MSAHWTTRLHADACVEAVEWARKQKTYAGAWAKCERPDWLLWLAGRTASTKAQRNAIVLAACDCAEMALQHVPDAEIRPRDCIATVRAYVRGAATLDQVRMARGAAYAAYADAADAAAADARSGARLECCKLIRARIKRPALSRAK